MNTKVHPHASDYLEAFLGVAWQANMDGALIVWVEAFQQALDDWRDDDCRRLLHQIKSSQLTDETEGLVRYVEGRWAEQRGDMEHAVSCYQTSLEINQDAAHSWRRAQVLSDLGLAYQSLGRLTDAKEALLTALPIFRADEDADALVEVCSHLAAIDTTEGNWQAALEWLEEGVSFAQTAEDHAVLLANKGVLHQARSEPALAQRCLLDALRIYQQLGDDPNIAYVLNNLGVLTLEEGQLGDARSYLGQALTLQQSRNDWVGAANTLSNLALIAETEGDLQSALTYLNEAVKDLETASDVTALSAALNLRGLVYADLGQWDMAALDFERSLELARQNGRKQAEIDSLNNLGTAYRHQNRLDEAEVHHNWSLALAEQLGMHEMQGKIMGNLGHVWFERGNHTRARECYQQALALAEATGDEETAAAALLGLCGVAFDAGDFDILSDLLQRTWDLAETSLQFDVLCRVLWMRGDVDLLTGEQEHGLTAYAEATVFAEEASDALLDATLARLAIHLQDLDESLLAKACADLEQKWKAAGLFDLHPELSRRLAQLIASDA